MRFFALALLLIACGDDAVATSDTECVPVPVPNCVELPSGATCERCPDAGGAEP